MMDRRQFLRTTVVGGTAYFADPARCEPFAADRRATMMLNNEFRLVRDPYGDERLALDAIIAAR
jgi:hypothetical protein